MSRRLCGIAQPILYHEFVPGYGDSWCTVNYDWSRRLTYFLRTVALRHDLAILVTRLNLDYVLLDEVDSDWENPVVVLDEVAQVRGIDISKFREYFQD